MSDTMTYPSHEGILNGIVKEYLEVNGFPQTADVYAQECEEMKRPVAVIESSPSPDKNLRQTLADKLQHIKSSLLEMLDSGQRDMFFQILVRHFPFHEQLAEEFEKLEFYLHLYFFVYDHHGNYAADQDERTSWFKVYLESKGEALAKCPEFLPYYALPYVPNLASHPTYQHLFRQSWPSEIREKTDKYLNKVIHLELTVDEGTKLYNLYMSCTKRDRVYDEVRQELTNTEKRCAAFIKKYRRVQLDYHNVIKVTAELIDAVEESINGKQLTAEYIQSVCERMFPGDSRHSINVGRAGSAGNYLRASLLPHPSGDANETSTVDGRPTGHQNSYHNSPLPHLDYSHIRYDLSSNNDRVRLLLLQALRLQLTDDRITPHIRQSILTSYIRHDVLSCSAHGGNHRLLGLVRASHPHIRQYTYRLLNAMACLAAGRTYLAQAAGLVPVLLETLREETEDMVSREMLVGVLQKLSLRKGIQAVMIEGGIIRWLLETLEDYNTTSDYCLEYSVALLMNLCLRQSGKRACEPLSQRLLKVLASLLGHQNIEICPYVNGVLYSMLSIASVREHARNMGLNDILHEHLDDNNAEVKRQIQYIIKQLNSDEVDGMSEESDSDDEDNEDDDEDDPTILEPELNRDEVVNATNEQLTGLELLYTEYIVRKKPGSSGSNSSRRHKRSAQSQEKRSKLSPPLSSRDQRADIVRPSLSAPSLERSNTEDSINSNLSLPYIGSANGQENRSQSLSLSLSESRQTTMTMASLSTGRRDSNASISTTVSNKAVKEKEMNLPKISKATKAQISSATTHSPTPRFHNQLEARERIIHESTKDYEQAALTPVKSITHPVTPVRRISSKEPDVIQPSPKHIEKLEEIGANVDEYVKAFSSRPKVARTPEPTDDLDTQMISNDTGLDMISPPSSPASSARSSVRSSTHARTGL